MNSKLCLKITANILLFLFLFQQKNVFAQQNLTGKIFNSADKKPIAATSIYIPDLRRITVSDEEGNYFFDNLPASTVQIQFRAVGFKSLVKTVNLESTATLDVELELSATELEEVLITSNNAKLPDYTPFPAYSISQNDLRKYSSPSVMGNLSYQPGVDKITIGNGIGKPVIRGLSFNRILLYGQGTRIENQQWDDHHDLGLSDVGIDNVEIVRGPAALIYGADALGGALIFTDEKPAAAGTTRADVNLGFASNTLGINSDIGIKSTNEKGMFYGLRIGGASHTSYVQGEDEEQKKKEGEEEEEFAPNSKMINMIAKANVGISKKWGVSKLSYSYFNQQIGIIEDESGDTLNAGEDEEEQREREMEAPYQDVTTHIISLENSVFFGKSKFNLNFSFQNNDRKEFEPLDLKEKELAIGLKLNCETYDLKWTSNSDKDLGIILGTQGLFLQNRNYGLESLVPDADVTDIAGYGLIRYDHNKLNLLGGIRVDMRTIEAESYENGEPENEQFILHHSSGMSDTIFEQETEIEKEYTPVSFSVGACYHPVKDLTLKLNGATGFTAPNYAQLGTFGKHEGTYRFEQGNINLDVEQNIEADAGIIWETPFVTLNLSAYVNKVSNYIYIVNTGDTMERIKPEGSESFPFYEYRQNDATLSGFEAGFDIHPRNIKWLDIKLTYAMINGTLDEGGNLPYIPANKLITEVKLIKDKFRKLTNSYFLIVMSNYSKQSNVAEYELSSDAYNLFDIHLGTSFNLGRQFANVDIYCTNVLNTAYFNQLSLVKYIGVRDMGRNIGIKIHLPIK